MPAAATQTKTADDASGSNNLESTRHECTVRAVRQLPACDQRHRQAPASLAPAPLAFPISPAQGKSGACNSNDVACFVQCVCALGSTPPQIGWDRKVGWVSKKRTFVAKEEGSHNLHTDIPAGDFSRTDTHNQAHRMHKRAMRHAVRSRVHVAARRMGEEWRQRPLARPLLGNIRGAGVPGMPPTAACTDTPPCKMQLQRTHKPRLEG
jgi:hypothetical protein